MFSDIANLRDLVVHQEFEALKKGCLACLIRFPENTAVKVLLALSRVHLQENEQDDDLNNTLELLHKQAQSSFDQDALCDLAFVYIAQKKLDQARELLQGILEVAPKHDLALARLAWCYMVQGESQKALLLFDRSLMLYPQRISAQLSRIKLLVNAYRVFIQKDGLELDQLDSQSAMKRENLAAVTSALEESFFLLHTQKNNTPARLWQSYKVQLQRLQLQLWVTLEDYALAEQWIETEASVALSVSEQGKEKEKKRAELEKQEASYSYWGVQYATLLAEHDQQVVAESFLKEMLTHYPTNLPILLCLSELMQITGKLQPALALLRKATEQDQDNSDLWCRLAQACLNTMTMTELARHAANKAHALVEVMVVGAPYSTEQVAAHRLQAKSTLAAVAFQEEKFDEAEGLFLEVLAEKPYFLPALSGLGQQWMQQGRIDEAVSLFEKIKEVNPAQGISALIGAHHFPEDEATLEDFEEYAKLPSLEGSLRSNLLFKLATAWEKRKQYDKAFEIAKQANDASLRTLKYDPKAHRNRSARIRYAFSSSLYKHRAGSGVSSTLPVFVVGMPRSGTTLIEQIIAGHSDIFGAGELDLIPTVMQGLNRWERHVGSGREYPDCIDDLTIDVSQGIANNLLKELQDYSPDAKYIVDKLPHNFENIGLIKFLFPNARIISVRRDPRDIALSNYFTNYHAKHDGMGFAYDLTHIGEQLADHNLIMHHWQQVFPNQILEVHYEQVINDLEGSARKMLDYIGVEWQPEVLKFNELERSVKTASVWQVRQPLYKTSKARWRHYKGKLAPLIKAINKSIESAPIEMLTLPVAGFLQTGVAHFEQGELDEAERCFKKMLHHNPDHAACQYMTGLVYFNKGYFDEGIPLVESAVRALPWRQTWRESLRQAYQHTGQMDKYNALAKLAPYSNALFDETGQSDGIDKEKIATSSKDNISQPQSSKANPNKANNDKANKEVEPLFALVGVEQFL